MKTILLLVLANACLNFAMCAHAAAGNDTRQIEQVVESAVRPVIAQNDIPGMAVAVSVRGKHRIFSYGVAVKNGQQKVSKDTLFEIGSMSKTFTATLGAYAQGLGKLSFSDTASQHLPALAGSRFDAISLLDLGTYSAGGLPLQFPDYVTDYARMISFFRAWSPEHAAGTYRLYSNPSIGLFGYLVATSLGTSFDNAMQRQLLPALGLSHTFIHVPKSRMANYAFGYSEADKPIRVTPGMLDSEAYGVKSTAEDMLRFIDANMDSVSLDTQIRRAILATHTGYYKVGDMTQGLGWEMLAYPTTLDRLLAANASDMAIEAHKVTAVAPPAPPQADTLINKTGSTNGFGAYAAFVPSKKIGIVILANKNYPIPARVRIAYSILNALDE